MSVPLALTAGSYVGTWDILSAGSAVSPTSGVTFFINGNGTGSCQDEVNNAACACSVNVTDPATDQAGQRQLRGRATLKKR